MTAAVAATGITGAQNAASAPPGTALTIYSNATPGAISPEAYRQPSRGALPGYAVVRQERDLDLAKGTTVLEQNYQFDLVSTDKLLQKYVDRPIAVEQVRGQATETFNGTLLS